MVSSIWEFAHLDIYRSLAFHIVDFREYRDLGLKIEARKPRRQNLVSNHFEVVELNSCCTYIQACV